MRRVHQETPEAIPEPLARFVAARLARAIELGEYKPGERLNETDIASRFGVSRAPVREALRILGADELVVQRPRRGTTVVALGSADISEMFEMRAALYAAVTRLFVRRATPAQLDEYAALIGRIDALAGDREISPRQFVQTTQAMSAFALAHCGNARLQIAFARMTRQAYRFYAEKAHSTMANRLRVTQLLARLLAAARAGDAERASVFAWRILEANHEAALAALAAEGDGG